MSKIIFQKETNHGIFKVFNDKPQNLDFLEVEQVHGKKICENKAFEQADGITLFKSENKKPLAIKTADCIPLLIIGNHGYGMIHAGWRGLQSQIHLQPSIKKLEPFYFFIGPHISESCFEVTKEFYSHFPKSHHLFNQYKDKITFNLTEQIKQDLKNTFPTAQIEESDICTFSNLAFNSYRRDKTNLRNWNIFFPL